MRRRDFIMLLADLAVTWPLAAGAQQQPPLRGILAARGSSFRT